MDQLAVTALLSGLFAAVIAIAATRAIEKFGGLMGGVLASLPTTVVPASIGLAARLQGDPLTAALFTIPVGMLINGLFLLQWRIWPQRLPKQWSLMGKLCAMLALSLSVWAVCAASAVVLSTRALVTHTNIMAFGATATVVLAALAVTACFTPLDAPKGSQHVPLRVLAIRGGMAALSIFVAVMLSSVSGIVAGMATTYPAIFSTVIASVWLSQGQAVQAGAVGPIMLGSLSVATYAMVFAGLAPTIGNPFASAAISWVTAVLGASVPSALFLRWRRSVSSRSHVVLEETHAAATATADMSKASACNDLPSPLSPTIVTAIDALPTQTDDVVVASSSER